MHALLGAQRTTNKKAITGYLVRVSNGKLKNILISGMVYASAKKPV